MRGSKNQNVGYHEHYFQFIYGYQSTIPINILEMPRSSDSLNYWMEQAMIENSVMGRFVNGGDAPENNLSNSNKIQEFVNIHDPKFVIIEKNNKVPHWVSESFSLVIEDEISGQKIYFKSE